MQYLGIELLTCRLRIIQSAAFPDLTIMGCQRSFLLFFCLVLMVSLHLSAAQHWSHGWYPGGKRDIDSLQSAEVSEDIKLCDGEDCTYLKIPRDKIVKTLLADMLARQLQKKK